MSNGVLPHLEDAKSKKSPKKNMSLESIQGDVDGENDGEHGKEKRKEKRGRKKERKLKQLVGNSETVVSTAEDGEHLAKRKRNAEATGLDTVVPDSEAKTEKKKKKKRRHVELEGTVEFGSTADPLAVTLDKPKKKRKRDTGDDSEISDLTKAKEKNKQKKQLSITDEPMPMSTSERLSFSTSGITLPAPAPAARQEQVTEFLAKHSITIHTPDGIPVITPVLSFDQLDIPFDLQSSFEAFKEPTPIQACTWPPALQGLDVVGIAETGSGKTLAFGIPALSRLITSALSISSQPTVSVLVVAPTRELALQTHDTLSFIGKPFGIASVAVFGGVPKEPQVRMLKSANKRKDKMVTRIVVGTPGRILDLVQDGVCDLSGVNYLVLDEADRMLDKGFENDIRNIISNTKPSNERQTMMFSATWPEAVRRLASTFQKKPVRVTVGSDDLTANSKVEQTVEVFEDSRSKDSRLLAHLRSMAHKKGLTASFSDSRILVFVLYKKEASRVEELLRRQGYGVGALHGDMTQNARLDALERFKSGTTGLMVATDVAARGLDIPNVGAVINYTFPLTIEDYIHRIGRTGRGGRSGKSITFFTGDNHERALAGELARVLREGGFDYEGLKKFPMTIKKKEHGVYGAFYRDDIPLPKGPTKIVF